MTSTMTITEARQYLEAKTDADLRGIIATASDRYLPVTAETRAALDWNAAQARDILESRKCA